MSIVEIAESRKEFVTDVDGYVYWWPEGFAGGHFCASTLRLLADELDKRNAAWNAQITEYFESNP